MSSGRLSLRRFAQLFFGLLSWSALVAPLSAQAEPGEREVANTTKLVALVLDQPTWCQGTVVVNVRSRWPWPTRDTADIKDLQRLLGRARATVEKECPSATTVRLTGYSAADKVFEGTASKADGWVLTKDGTAPPAIATSPAAASPTPAPTPVPAAPVAAAPQPVAPTTAPVPSPVAQPPVAAPTIAPAPPGPVSTTPPAPPPAATPTVPATTATVPAAVPPSLPSPQTLPVDPATASVRKCDALAAHADDPEAFSKGVDDAGLNAPQAIAACEAAIRNDKSPRLAFQLARAYLKANRFSDAIAQLLAASEQQHGAALAYLADLVLDGAPGLSADPVLARQLYERAVASGFMPAKKVLDEFEDMTDVVAKDEAEEAQAAAPVASGKQQSFVEPDIMNSILSRQFDSIGVDEIWTKKFLVNIADNIRAVCSAHFSQSDVDRLKREAAVDHYRVSSNQTLGGGLMGTLATILAMRDNPGAYAQQASSRSEDGFDEGMKDTGALFQRHMCNTPGLSAFSKNLAAYVTNQDAPLPQPDAITRACLSNPPPSRYDAQQFCMCFGSLLQSTAVSQKQRKNLVSDFRKTSMEVMDRNPGPYRACTQGPR